MNEDRPVPPSTGLGAWWDPIGAEMSFVMMHFTRAYIDGLASCDPVSRREISPAGQKGIVAMTDGDAREAVDWKPVHDFWFPADLEGASFETHVQRAKWWMQGGANAELGRFAATVEAARSGRLNHWLIEPIGRLSLIIVLDQFPRGLFAGTADAFSSDQTALRIVEEGFENRHFKSLSGLWERFFFLLPLVHAEGPGHLGRMARLISVWENTARDVPQHLLPLHKGALDRARAHFDVIAEFGRFPHRNGILGRRSTPQEEEYIARGDFVHTRPISADELGLHRPT
jgi:uncharacterized protein (DUF924 family)